MSDAFGVERAVGLQWKCIAFPQGLALSDPANRGSIS
jgi:hypothetical protein